MRKQLTLRRIKNTNLPNIWGDVLFGSNESLKKQAVLQLIILFTSSEDPVVQKLGYRLALLHSKSSSDFTAAHSLASMNGTVPVAKLCENLMPKLAPKESFVEILRTSFSETIKDDDIYLTAGQQVLKDKFFEDIDQTLSVVAPTSYGKSSLISLYVENTNGHCCIIVPTKSLLAQTRKMLFNDLPLEVLRRRKIVTHYEMYQANDAEIIAVLTQERYLRLLQLFPSLQFHHLIIDESHNLLENDQRTRALASTILVSYFRNPHVNVKYLSPFIADSNNLKLRISPSQIVPLIADEYIKSEIIYHADFRSSKDVYVYDQFMDKSYRKNYRNSNDPYSYILDNSSLKNIIYLNRPLNTHNVSIELSGRVPEIKSRSLEKACKDLSEYLHEGYLLISCVRNGIIFHHGSVPDNIRLYLENLYKSCDEIKYVITTSTLLEGVNLPADRMFLMNIKKGNRNLSASQLKNLMGRVSRFKEAFSGKSIDGLTPEIHFVGNDLYPKSTKVEKYIKEHLKEGKDVRDRLDNPLLLHTELDENKERDFEEELTFLGNSEEGIFDGTDLTFLTPKTDLGKLCFIHRIADFDVLSVEESMNEKVIVLKRLGTRASNAAELIELINEVFLRNLPEDQNKPRKDIDRLRDNIKARDFYAMVLGWRIDGASYNFMINHFLKYWRRIESDAVKKIVYAGSWGTQSRNDDGFDMGNYYVDISALNQNQRATLAVSRIEAEMAYLDYNLMKYVDCLKDLELVDPEFLDKLKYGKNFKDTKNLIQSGMSHSLANLLVTKEFSKSLVFNSNGTVSVISDVLIKMENVGINSVLINEASYHTVPN